MPKRFEECYEGKPILYWFHQDRVFARDVSTFLETFDVSRIQAAGKLKELRGIVHLVFRGWDEDPRALHEIPEVRAFVEELDRQFPYLAYITTTQTEVLRIMALCLVPNSVTARLGENPGQFVRFAASYNVQAYHQVLTRWFQSVDEIAGRGRCFTLREHAQNTIELANYFGVEWYWKK